MLKAPVMTPVRPDCPPPVAAGCLAGEKGMAIFVGYLLMRQRLSRPASQTSIGLGGSPLGPAAGFAASLTKPRSHPLFRTEESL